MPTATLEEILEEETSALPPDEQRQLREVLANSRKSSPSIAVLVIMGAVYMHMRKRNDPLTHDEWQQLAEVLDRAASKAGLLKDAHVRLVRGKYAHLKTSSEAFAAQKREEVRLEDL